MRTFFAPFSPSVWAIEGATLVSTTGDGMAVTFLLIYLHNVRGIPLDLAGLVLAASGVGAVAGAPIFGQLVDRLGPRRPLVLALCISAAGYLVYAVTEEVWQAFAAAAVVGLGRGGTYPTLSALLSALVPRERRHSIFGLHYTTINIGAGAGGVLGGFLITVGDPQSYVRLFYIEAASFLVVVALLPLVRRFVAEPDDTPAGDGRRGYGVVLRDRVFLAFVGLNTVFFTAGLAVSELVAVYAKNEAGVGEGAIGIMYAVNAVAIIALQLPVTRLLEGRRRALAMLAMSVVWAVSWLVTLVAGLEFDALAAAILFSLALGLFGLGECVHSATHAPLAVDLSPQRIRGRYLAVAGLAVPVALIVGPALGGVVLRSWPHVLWPLSAGAVLAAAGGMLYLERFLPAAARVTPASTPEAPPVPAGIAVEVGEVLS